MKTLLKILKYRVHFLLTIYTSYQSNNKCYGTYIIYPSFHYCHKNWGHCPCKKEKHNWLKTSIFLFHSQISIDFANF